MNAVLIKILCDESQPVIGEVVFAQWNGGFLRLYRALSRLSARGYPIPGRSFERAEKLGTILAGEVLKILERIDLKADVVVAAKRKLLSLTLKALPTLDGELFVEIGLNIKAKSPFAQTCLVGYANG
ncbi:hypothetical protein CSB45_05585 [candidate division KSB3 bacterium]|uniref:Uncharacterized protein n=1 Tax=candidate division KSB3 bacterium TaxID=2044937 RepID=A0A2G6E6P0_9BACT|nr:MAG: hypothetical protein CSB45_05585 [candidate division KSB3 bacterium]PIE30127.1 MAG: hypothetical protein CSA57_04295 [candidate division KSB3 bacterium]